MSDAENSKAYFIIESAETYRLGGDAPIVKWLEAEGFVGRVCGGRLGSSKFRPWIYVDIDAKEFVYGVFGAKATAGPIVGETHLTIDEFKSIYAIIQKSRQRMKDVDKWWTRIGEPGSPWEVKR